MENITQKIKIQLLSILMICFLISCSKDANEDFEFGESFDRTKMDTFLSILEQENLAMGSVSIWKNGQLDY